MMRNRILYILIVIAVIFSFFSILPRYNIEENNKGVELVFDDNYLNELVNKVEGEKNNILKLFKKNGLTGIAIYPNSIRTLINNKNARLITANELMRIELLSPGLNPVFKDFPFSDKSAFLVIADKDVRSQIQKLLPSWQEEYGLEYREENNKLVIFFKEWKTKYVDLATGFHEKNMQNIKNADLDLILRLNNDIIGYDQLRALKDTDSEMIIFSGKEILGYSDNLEETASVMNNNDIKYGMIEPFIAKQEGSTGLARLTNYNLLRVHSIEQEEMDKYGQQRIINRYLRAVRERDVRVLYLKPFFAKREADLLTDNLQFIKNLRNRLKNEGFNPAEARPYQYFKSPLLYLLIISAGIFSCGIFLLERLFARRLKLSFYIMLLLVAGVEFLLAIQGRIILLRQILALGSSIIFPVLAISSGLNKSHPEHWLLSFIKVTGISLLGVLFMVASLSELSFLLKVNQFRGVKLSFLLPLLLISIYYYRKYLAEDETNIGRITVSFLETEIKVKHLLLLFLIGIGGIIYIGRTGNYPLLPVPAWEISIRDLLEEFLYIRPRFKTFLLGYPFLVLVLALKNKKSFKLALYPALLLAAIGQITVLNTFSHIHTPLKISIIRFANGVWLGLLIGIIFLVIIKFLVYIKEKLYA